jgi:arylsulfatase A-like enzyme
MGSDRPSLAAELGDAGFHTGAFTSNPFLQRGFDYDSGFDVFRDYHNPIERQAAKLFPDGIERPRGKIEWLDQRLPVTDVLKWMYQFLSGSSRPYTPAETIVDDTIEFIEETETPFFCWTHLMDVHHPCYPPEEYRERHGVDASVEPEDVRHIYSNFVSAPADLSAADVSLMRQLYTAAVDYVDDTIQDLLDALSDAETLDDTVIVLTSDHGELFGEHGEYDKPPRLYDELLQVPLLVHSPTDLPRRVTNGLFSLLDLPPLIHSLLDIDPADGYQGSCTDEQDPRHTIVAEEMREDEALIGVRGREWRYEIDQIRGERRLWELSTQKRRDISRFDDQPEVQEIREVANAHLQRVDATAVDLEVSKDVEERLNKLGYLE